MLSKKVILTVVLFVFSFILKAQTVEVVIANYIGFIGGEKHLKKINSIVSSGTYNYGGMEFPFEACSKAPDLYKYTVRSNGKYFAQAFDGKQGWKIDGFKEETTKTILTGNEARAMANEADVNLESPFINYKEKGYRAALEGKDSVDNICCYKVKFIQNNNDSATYFFSIDNFSLLKKQAVSKNAELDNSILDIYYSDYRVVNGIRTPFKIVSKVSSQTILIITVKQLQLNVPVQDDIFKP